MKYLSHEELEFLQQSNYIENETSPLSLDDAVEAWQYLRGEEHLTEKVILKTHKILMRTRELDKSQKGKWRTYNVRVGNRVCPPFQEIPGLMWKWRFDSIRKSPPIDDKELHIQFEHIHPFADGNGRVGRMLMNWQRIKKLNKPILIIKEEEKWEYYKWFS